MSLSSIAKQGNFFYHVPHVLDANDPDAEGQYIGGGGDELHSFSCPCVPCGTEYARLDLLLKKQRMMEAEE